MADQVNEVKAKTDIVSLIGEHIELKKAGRNYKANCPFHSEKMPSFMVSPELQIFKCFGCGEAGDAFAFLQKHEGMEFYEALRVLADRAGVKLKPSAYRRGGEKDRLYQINYEALKFYHYILIKHPSGRQALNYLAYKRGLKSETIKEFLLGFSPNTPFAIRKYLVDKKRYKDSEVEKVGIAYKTRRGYIDRFRGRLIFPLFNHRDNVAGFAGRILPGESREVAKYINTPETPVYHKSDLLYGLNLSRRYIKKKKSAIVVEGELDLISSWQVGVKNVVALKGSAFTEEQARLISRFAKKLILAFDADLAGSESALRGIKIAESFGLQIKVAQIKGYKDPDEIAQKAPKKYLQLLKGAVSAWDFIIDTIFSKHDARTGEGKALISREVVPVIAAINDEIVKAHYIGKVARKLSVSEEVVVEQVKKIVKTSVAINKPKFLATTFLMTNIFFTPLTTLMMILIYVYAI